MTFRWRSTCVACLEKGQGDALHAGTRLVYGATNNPMFPLFSYSRFTRTLIVGRHIAAISSVALGLLAMGGCSSSPPSDHAASTIAASQDAAPRLLWINGPAGKLRVDDGGSGGIPVVLIPGLAGDRTLWQAQLAHLRKSRRALAVDPRGFGESEIAKDSNYSMEALASDLAAVVDALGIERFVIVGHSMASAVMCAYAGAHPDRVAGLLFVDPTGDMTQTPQKEQDEVNHGLNAEPKEFESFREAWFADMLGSSAPPVREKVLEALHRAPQQAVAKTVAGVYAYNPIPALKNYHGPMLTLYLSNNNESFALQNILTDMPNRLITGTGHWLMMDKPADFNATLDEFLSKVEQAK